MENIDIIRSITPIVEIQFTAYEGDHFCIRARGSAGAILRGVGQSFAGFLEGRRIGRDLGLDGLADLLRVEGPGEEEPAEEPEEGGAVVIPFPTA